MRLIKDAYFYCEQITLWGYLGLEIPNSQCYEKWRRATVYAIYHSPACYHFSLTFVQFLSEGLQNFGKDYHIEKSIRSACYQEHFEGLVQDCSNSIAKALELLQSCAKPLICWISRPDIIFMTILKLPWPASNVEKAYNNNPNSPIGIVES